MAAVVNQADERLLLLFVLSLDGCDVMNELSGSECYCLQEEHTTGMHNQLKFTWLI